MRKDNVLVPLSGILATASFSAHVEAANLYSRRKASWKSDSFLQDFSPELAYVGMGLYSGIQVLKGCPCCSKELLIHDFANIIPVSSLVYQSGHGWSDFLVCHWSEMEKYLFTLYQEQESNTEIPFPKVRADSSILTKPGQPFLFSDDWFTGDHVTQSLKFLITEM